MGKEGPLLLASAQGANFACESRVCDRQSISYRSFDDQWAPTLRPATTAAVCAGGSEVVVRKLEVANCDGV